MSSLFEELKRRNVFRVALAYVAVAWLIIQVADIALENFGAPDWVMKTLIFLLAIGFPVALLFAWAYEMTPDGIKREKDVDRSQSITRQTGQKLNRMIISVLVVAVAFLLIDKFMLRGTPPEAEHSEDKSVAVLPFVAMSRGEDDEYFADGLTEEILNALTRVPGLLVTARTSAFYFKGQDIPIPEIAEKLGVAHIVEGSVRRDGERLRVTAQLIRASDGFHLWSKNYNRDTADTFGVQTDIAEEISAALGIVLDQQQREQMAQYSVRDPETFIALQKGFELFNAAHGAEGQLDQMLEANRWFDKVLQLSPNLAIAHIGRADYYTHLLIEAAQGRRETDTSIHEAYEKLVANLDAAIRTARDDAHRLSATADLAIVTGNWRGAQELAKQFADHDGCSAPGWVEVPLLAFGGAEHAKRMGDNLMQCDPLSFAGWRGASSALIWMGDSDRAITIAKSGMEKAPHIRTLQTLFSAYLAAGRFEDAEHLVRRDIRRYDVAKNYATTLVLARGDIEDLDEFESAGFSTLAADVHLRFYAQAGDRDAANARAAELDAHPYGYLALMLVPQVCMCGAPWDLEATPNFARLVADADLQWPPASPIQWPLKDW